MLNSIFQMPEMTRTTPFLNISDSLSLALFFIVIGYEFLLFCYFLLIRFRKTRKLYWFYFSMFFLLIAISRGLFCIYDFIMPYFAGQIDANPLLPFEVYRWAQWTGWLAAATLVGLLSTLLFTKQRKVDIFLRIICPLVVVGLSFLWIFLPPQYLLDPNYFIYNSSGYNINPGVTIIPVTFWANMAIGRFYLNYVILPILNFLLPLIFFYLGAKSVGVIRRSSLLNGLGFLTYYAGRTLQPTLGLIGASVLTQAILSPLIILLGLLFLALGNFMLSN